MDRIKKLLSVSVFVLMILAFSLSVYAGTSTYVPASCRLYSWNESTGSWEESGSYKYTYDSKGRLTKSVYKYKQGSKTLSFEEKYTWKGDYITSCTNSGYMKSTKTRTTYYDKYVYKKNRIIKETQTTKFGSKKTVINVTYKWKNNTAKLTYKQKGGSKYYRTIKVDKKKRLVYSNRGMTNTYTYHSNGNLKSCKSKSDYANTTNFNKQGYITSIKGRKTKWMLINPEEYNEKYDYAVSYTTAYEYVMDSSKNCPKEWVATMTDSEGTVKKTKCVISSFKKVSKSRNCDASGRNLNLGGQNLRLGTQRAI